MPPRKYRADGMIGELRSGVVLYAHLSGLLADEAISDHTNVSNSEVAHHDFDDLNEINEQVYEALQRARQS